MISQHADSMGAPTACENAGIPNVCYNISTVASCPNTYLVFSRINWEPYFEYMINQTIAGEQIDVDWVGTLAGNSVIVTDLNEAVAAAGTQEAIDAAYAALIEGVLGGSDHHLAAIHVNLSLVGKVNARDHIHQRGFAAAVFAQDGQDLSPVHVQVRVIVGHHAAEAFGDSAHL